MLFDRVLDAVVVASLASGTIALWNRATEHLFGYSADEAIGQSIEMLMPAPMVDLHRAGMQRYQRIGHGPIIDSAVPVEMPAVTKAGDEIRVELVLSTLTHANGERFVLAVMRDATHRKRAELARLQLQNAHALHADAEAKLAGRDQLLGRVGHALQALISLDSNRFAALSQIARGLADVQRIDRGELAITAELTDLATIVTRAVERVRRTTMRHLVSLDKSESVLVRADAARIEQVLDAVLDNAVRHNPQGCPIQVQVELHDPQRAHVTVRDYGRGIPLPQRPHLFARSQPAGAGPAVGPQGLGLSLFAARHIMELHGGALTAAFPSSGGLIIQLCCPSAEPDDSA